MIDCEVFCLAMLSCAFFPMNSVSLSVIGCYFIGN